jgi:cobalt/nickel transport system permease protein
MHIPDGYLSPSTCAALFAGATPFWYAALRRTEAALASRLVPLIALFAAASFVLMMFNIPLPGGTTGHAVGMALAAIVLGPWGAMLAISIALTIQAVFFGDGGITALGANCLNMAVAGPLAAAAVYRLVGGRRPAGRRQVVAAGLAGYAAINVAALLAAVELGLQPLLFHDAAGVPLYAPYPLHIALPAILLGHLTLAGLAELTLTAGAVGWLQRAEPALLAGPPAVTAPSAPTRPALVWPTSRRLWLALAVLLVASPLGLLAAGTAWGEWSVEDLTDPSQRAAIVDASLGAPLPPAVPAGLARLATFWTAPIPDYAPAFLKSSTYGYLMSALLGTGLVLAASLLLGVALARRAHAPAAGT